MFSKSLIKIILLMSFLTSWAHATTIDYTVTEVGGSRWRYDYTIRNDSLGSTLQEWTIYFDDSLFSNLSDE